MIRPLGSRIIVKPVEQEEVKRSSGILVPTVAQEKPNEGVVVAAGPGHRENGVFIATTIKRGDKVFFGKYAGQEVTIDNAKHLIMHEDDVLGVFDEVAAVGFVGVA